MAEIGISVAAKLAEYLVDPVVRRARYLFCFNNFVGDLQKAKTELESTLQGMKERKEEANRNAEEIVQPVEKWLNDVEKVLDDVRQLEERVKASKSCLNATLRYSVAKDVASKTKQMNDLNKNCKFEQFSRPMELPGIKYFSSKDFVLFDCTKSAYDKLLKAIQDDKSSMIGLVGMGGSGKTTLAKVVGKQVEELKLFDKVVITVVSQVPKVRDIQAEIAEQLSFKLEEETKPVRAQRLSQRLKTEKILLILDDVWEKLDLEAIGIPLNENDSNCSVLLTTRMQEVCTSMGCQSKIELSVLTQNEGWNLFRQCAQIEDDSPEELREVARKIANKCQGLLIAIVTVGSTLRPKTFDQWKLALSRLENFQPIDVPNGMTSPYACLKLSYDNLTNQLAKSLFLLCGMFPEDHKIHMEDLVRFGRGRLEEAVTLMDLGTMRLEFNAAVNTLIDCCLLMPTEKECVRMHDMVRDVALWMASSEGQAMLVARKRLKEDDTIKDKAVISLWDMRKPELTHQLLCPTLKILLHHIPYNDYEMPNAYLEGRKNLKVLALIKFAYTWKYYKLGTRCNLSIPQSIGSLTNLQTLCLRRYNLGDISVFGSIKGLEILDLRGSSFIELPNEIGALNKLKLLDLFFCEIKKNTPYEVITRCSQLQELYIWAVGDYSPENISFPKLQRYFIWLSKRTDYKNSNFLETFVKNFGELRYLCIDFEGFHASALSDSSIKDLFLRAEGLYLMNIQEGYNNIVPGMMDKQHMSRLTSLTLRSCYGIKCLVDAATLVNTSANPENVNVIQAEAVFSKLVWLELVDMQDLEEMFRGASSRCSLKMLQRLQIRYCPQSYSIFSRNSDLCNLKILKLKLCPKLPTTLFTPPIAQTLVVLEELCIEKCKSLKQITAEDKEEEGNAVYSRNQGPCSMGFAHLRILKVIHCNNLESLFPMSFAQRLERLEVLKVIGASMLNCVFGTVKEHGLSSCQNSNPDAVKIEISMPALRNVSLVDQPNLIAICPEHYRPTTLVRRTVWVVTTTFSELCNQILPAALQAFVNLESLLIRSIERLEGIIEVQVEEGVGCNTKKEQAPLKLSCNLSEFVCAHHPELKFIWNGPANFLSLQRLRYIHLIDCPKLKTIFSPTIVANLPELTLLVVEDCNELEEIICLDSEEGGQFRNLSARSQQVCFPKLETIRIRRCDKFKYIFSYSMACHCPSLWSLAIKECSHLEQVVKFEHKAAGNEGGVGVVVDDEEDENHVLFPKLNKLELTKLPNLTGIFPGYEFKSNHRIEDCPKYTSSSISA